MIYHKLPGLLIHMCLSLCTDQRASSHLKLENDYICHAITVYVPHYICSTIAVYIPIIYVPLWQNIVLSIYVPLLQNIVLSIYVQL